MRRKTSPNPNRQTHQEPPALVAADERVETVTRPTRKTHQEPPVEIKAEPSPAPAPPKPSPPEPAPAPAAAVETAPFRPVRRPPMAVLQIFDDGRKSAELVRLRQAKFVIGRTDGDLVLGNDPLLSGRHAELERVCRAGCYSWVLRDLNSRNGTFVRVKGMALKEETEILISRNRFRFAAAGPSQEEIDAEESSANVRQTINWRPPSVLLAANRPLLVELLHSGEGRKFSLRDDCQFIGRDPRQCRIALPEDETLDLRHAKAVCDAQGRWQLEDCDSVNGVWLRVREIALAAQSSFLLGEQVFALAIP
jgi:hypothetical protein